MLKKGLLALVISLMISGCSTHTGEQDFNSIVKSIEQGLEASDGVSLQTQAVEIKRLYDKHEWKIQLLGDEGEYERLNEAINRLIAAIEAEEMTGAKLELATLKTIVKDIYSL